MRRRHLLRLMPLAPLVLIACNIYFLYMKAVLKNYRQSPRKVRLVAKVLRGKDVSRALSLLRFIDKKASDPMRKLIASAVKNAEQAGKQSAGLKIADVVVNQGPVLKRYRPRAFGRSTLIKRETSTIRVELQ